MAAPHLVNLLANGQDLPETELRQRVCRVVDYLIDRDLLLGLAQKDGFAPNREDGLTQLAEIEERFGGAEKFDAMLKWQGLSRDDVIEQVSSEQALARWMEAKVKPGVVVDD
jgi:hypothetical protein